MATDDKWATVRVRNSTRLVAKIAAASADRPMSDVLDEAIRDWVLTHQDQRTSRRHR